MLLQPPPLEPPALIVPAAREVAFGRVIGTVGPGTRRILVRVDGRLRADRRVRGRRFDFALLLPRRDVTVRVTAVGRRGRRASTVVGPVFGLPRRSAPRFTPPALPGYEDGPLGRTVRTLARGFPGTCGLYVQDLGTGAGAAWNARGRFPAASTLKLAIAVEVLRVHPRKPTAGARIDRLLRRMLVYSESEAANELLVWLGGSTSGGSARVNSMLRALGLTDTEMYGGYEVERATFGRRRKPIPLRVESRPAFVGKYTTAWDLARLTRYVHLAADGKGLMARRFRGSLTPSDARFLLYVLAHVRESGRLDRFLRGGGVAVLHKGGWIERARHDSGLVYWPGGVFAASVLTWNAGGVGTSSDLLAGRVARAALERFGPRL